MNLSAQQGILGEACNYTGLQDAVRTLVYHKRGWRFWLTHGATMNYGGIVPELAQAAWSSTASPVLFPPVLLHVELRTPDSGDTQRMITVEHVFWVPHPTYASEWDRWLLERILDVERHEAMELFEVDGKRPFYPQHGPEGRLYEVVRHQ